MLKGHVFARQIFENPIFALFINTFLNGENGVSNNYKNGMEISYSGSTLKIDSGAVCIQGRFLEESNFTELEAGADTAYCRLVIEVDLDKENTESHFIQGTYKILKNDSDYPNLIQTEIVKNNAGIYQYELASFKIGESGITDFIDKRTFLDFETIYEQIKEHIRDIDNGSAFIMKSTSITRLATVEKLKTYDAEVGEYIQTEGYYETNDGGGASYRVRKKENDDIEDGGSIHFIGDNLVAELINNKVVNVKQFGAKGDKTTDDTNAFIEAISYGKKIIIPIGNYVISKTISIRENKVIEGVSPMGSEINYTGTGNCFEIKYIYFGETIIKNLYIHKGSAYAETDTTSVGILLNYNSENTRNVVNLKLENVNVRYFYRNLYMPHITESPTNCLFENCKFEGGYYNISVVGGFCNIFRNCQFKNGIYAGIFYQSGEGSFHNCCIEGNKRGVFISPSDGKFVFNDCFFENTDITEESNNMLFAIDNSTVINDIACIDIINSHFYGGWIQAFLTNIKTLNLKGNTFYHTGRGHIVTVGSYVGENWSIKGNKFETNPTNLNKSFIDYDYNSSVDIDTSSATIGTYSGIKARKIGKLVFLNGTITNFTDEARNQVLFTIPEGFRPSQNIEAICSMNDSTRYQKTANLRIYANGSVQLRGYDAESSTSNVIALDGIAYISD